MGDLNCPSQREGWNIPDSRDTLGEGLEEEQSAWEGSMPTRVMSIPLNHHRDVISQRWQVPLGSARSLLFFFPA